MRTMLDLLGLLARLDAVLDANPLFFGVHAIRGVLVNYYFRPLFLDGAVLGAVSTVMICASLAAPARGLDRGPI